MSEPSRPPPPRAYTPSRPKENQSLGTSSTGGPQYIYNPHKYTILSLFSQIPRFHPDHLLRLLKTLVDLHLQNLNVLNIKVQDLPHHLLLIAKDQVKL